MSYSDELNEIGKAAFRLRSTAPVDDEFPSLMFEFDSVLKHLNGKYQFMKVGVPESFCLIEHLKDQIQFSENTFGPGTRTKGIVDHIKKELNEILAKPDDLEEWIDLIMLSMDGAWRAGFTPKQIATCLSNKLAKNKVRTWPDWRNADPDKGIEHVRNGEAA